MKVDKICTVDGNAFFGLEYTHVATALAFGQSLSASLEFDYLMSFETPSGTIIINPKHIVSVVFTDDK